MTYYSMQRDWLADAFMRCEDATLEGVPLRNGHVMQLATGQPFRFTTAAHGDPSPRRDGHPPHLEDGAEPAMSLLLLEVLQRAGVDNLQTWPAVVRNPVSGQVWDNYVVFNVVGLIDCVDLQASEGTTLMEGADAGPGAGPPPLVDLTKIVLKKNVVTGPKMFREPLQGSLIVGDDVMQALRQSAPPEKWGIRLVPLEHAGG